MNDCENCKYEETIKSIKTDIRDLFSKFNSSAIDQTSMQQDIKHIILTINEIKSKIDVLTSAPSKRWEAIVIAGITAIIGVAVGYAFKK